MRKIFIKTQNVKNFIALMNNIKKCPENVPRMALVYGEPGLGKTQTILWWATNNDAVYIRCNNMMSPRWLLSEIAEEMGEMPFYNTAMLFKQVEVKLKQEPKVIIVDEIDYLVGNTHAVETLRDIHDKINAPIILVGMGKANKKLMRYKHINDRLYEKLEFKPFLKADIKEIIEALSELSFTDCAIEYIYSQSNRFRQIVKFINKIEQIAKTNGIKKFDKTTLQEFIVDETKNPKASQTVR